MSEKLEYGSKKRTDVSRADLLRLYACDHKNLEVFADFVGYEYLSPKKEPIKKSLPAEELKQEPKQKKAPEEIEHRFVAPKEDIKFWHVTEFKLKDENEISSNKPAWVDDTSIKPFADGEICANVKLTPPQTPPLVPWSQLWPFLRSALAERRCGRVLDINQVVELAAKLAPIKRLPRKKRNSWASTCKIILDLDRRLIPFWDDINAVYHNLQKLRGSSGLEAYSISDGPYGKFYKCEEYGDTLTNFQIEADVPLLILSDLGCFHSERTTESWLHFGKQLKNMNPIVLTPCPPRLWDQRLLQYFHLVWWDRGRKLPRSLYRKSKIYTNNTIDESYRAKRLLTLLTPAIRIEPSLLRAARLLLPKSEIDAAAEFAAWNHEDIYASSWVLVYHEDKIEEYRQAFSIEKDMVLREQVIALIEKHHAHLSPCVLYEEKMIAGALLCISQEQSKEFMQKYFRTLMSFENKENLKKWFLRFAERQHPQVWQQNEILTQCWYKINAEKGEKLELKRGMSADDIAWMMQEQQLKKYILRQVGEAFVVEEDKDSESLFLVGSRLTEIITKRQYLEVFHHIENEIKGYYFNLDENSSPKIPGPLTGKYVFSTDLEQITVESLTPPNWADTIGCDNKGIDATINNNHVHWFPAGKYGKYVVDYGFWGESIDFDEYGLYVDFMIKDINVRMRWIEAGTFMMGSPETELERDEDELLHKVTLTEGFWLAETTCTQELWETIMGSNPSHFKGEDQPVENVSWEDVGKFIGEVNRMFPYLSLCLPTEAQWEYACRANTETPFSFGEDITSEQVNYNGNYPYLGKKGINRGQTVAVKLLPCNQWGLYQMHGNVWEWCSDWYSSYSIIQVENPVGSVSGSYRVVRGGSWYDDARDVRSACRFRNRPVFRYHDVGFRLSRGQKKEKAAELLLK